MAGAGAGAGAAVLRDPTEEEARSLQQVVQNSWDLAGIQTWLDAHPNVRIDTVTAKEGRNLYMDLMFDARINRSHPLLQEVLRRNPDPTLKDNGGMTAADIAETRARGRPPYMLRKARAAREYYEQWHRNLARDVANLQRAGKDPLNAAAAGALADKTVLTTVPSSAQELVRSQLSGETGSAEEQLRKLSVKAGVPQGGRRKRRTHRRRVTRRKTKSRR